MWKVKGEKIINSPNAVKGCVRIEFEEPKMYIRIEFPLNRIHIYGETTREERKISSHLTNVQIPGLRQLNYVRYHEFIKELERKLSPNDFYFIKQKMFERF